MISALLDRTKYKVRLFCTNTSPLIVLIVDNVDPQIKKTDTLCKCSCFALIDLRIVMVYQFEEIKFAAAIGKPVVAIKITESTASDLLSMNIPVISNRKDSLENWIRQNV